MRRFVVILVFVSFIVPVFAQASRRRSASPYLPESVMQSITISSQHLKITVFEDDGELIVRYRAIVPESGVVENVVMDCDKDGLADDLEPRTIKIQKAVVLWVSLTDPCAPHILSSFESGEVRLQEPRAYFFGADDGALYIPLAAAGKCSGTQVRDWSTISCVTK